MVDDSSSQDALFTSDYRQGVLDRVVAALEADERIIGVLVVGSGAVGFEDEHSDIDLCIVCPDDQCRAIYDDWLGRFQEVLDVIHWSPVTYGPSSFLYAFLLEGFLELDAGFIGIGALVAKRERWKVAFDRSRQIAEIMARTWENRPATDLVIEYRRRIDGIWHHIIHVGQALRRGQPCRALHYLDTIRDRALELAMLRTGLDISHFREVDRLPPELKPDFSRAIPETIDYDEIFRALGCLVDCFFREARAWDKMLDLDLADRLEPRMREYLRLLQG